MRFHPTPKGSWYYRTKYHNYILFKWFKPVCRETRRFFVPQVLTN